MISKEPASFFLSMVFQAMAPFWRKQEGKEKRKGRYKKIGRQYWIK